ncbi:MAG: class I SAM-dependent methyltransferase [Chloroflexi bacterium]|nr:class I SAM-dependent methyltransferase [Chloroflexota bacterium]
MTKKWYKELYENFDAYGEEPYAQNTSAEVDFIEQVMAFDRTKSILDVGCGNGRHTLELARRGYAVTGIDLSETMLEYGRRQAAAKQLTIQLSQCDARQLPFRQHFDAAIMLCEGAFSLMENDDMDLRILFNIYRALKPGGKLIMTAPNAAFMIVHPSPGFDLITLREQFMLDKTQPDGVQKTLDCTQRYYTCPELRGMFDQVGFQSVVFFACTGTGYDREQKPTRDQFELGAIAEKKS